MDIADLTYINIYIYVYNTTMINLYVYILFTYEVNISVENICIYSCLTRDNNCLGNAVY